jgi:hypothetical protein
MLESVKYGRDQIGNNASSRAFSIIRFASKLLFMCDKEVFIVCSSLQWYTNTNFFFNFRLEFGQYMVVDIKVPLRKETFMKTLMLFYTYLLFNQIIINIKKDVLGSRSLLSLVQSNGMSFLAKQRLYNYEI